MLVRSAVTVMPVLVGLVAGVTVTVRSVVSEGCGLEGLAEPVAARLPPALHGFVGDEVLRGTGPPTVKSEELLSVSVQPAPFLTATVVFDSVAVGEVSRHVALEP